MKMPYRHTLDPLEIREDLLRTMSHELLIEFTNELVGKVQELSRDNWELENVLDNFGEVQADIRVKLSKIIGLALQSGESKIVQFAEEIDRLVAPIKKEDQVPF